MAKKGRLRANIGKWLRSNSTLLAALLALAGVLITQVVTTSNSERSLEEQRALENAQAEREQQHAEDRSREEQLQTYLDDMGTMLLDRDLPNAEPGEPRSSLARAKTFTVLERLDEDRKAILLQFLQESSLIKKDKPVVTL